MVRLAPFRTAPAGARARASKGNGSFRRRRGEGRFAPGLIPNWSRGPSGKPESCAGRPTASNRCALSTERPSAFSSSGRRSSTGAAMRADLAARLRRTMRGEAIAENGVTGVAGVTGPTGLRLKPQQLRQLRPLRLENGNGEKSAREGVSSPVTAADRARLRRHRRAGGDGGRSRAGLLSRRMGAAQSPKASERVGSRMAARPR